MNSSKASVFKFSLVVPLRVSLPESSESTVSRTVSRNDFYDWLWVHFSSEGLLGVHEGTLLSEEAADQGLETDSWTVDSAEAPRDRDWVGQMRAGKAELYFSGRSEAEKAFSLLRSVSEMDVGPVEEQADQDWDAEWKASFLNAGAGVEIPPFWRIVPPWVEKADHANEQWIKINPGAGFGTGTHETTQLCLQALGEYQNRTVPNLRLGLDFGCGSGILSVGMARLGLIVDAVEIDPLALDNARENAQLNDVQDHVTFSQRLPQNSNDPTKSYQFIVANILKPVLLEFASELVQRLAPHGVLILSGLIESDVKPVMTEYCRLLQLPVAQIYERGEWRSLVWVRM